MTATEGLRPESTVATVSLDAHGGDFGVNVTVNAAIEALQVDHALNVILVGQQDVIEKQLCEVNPVEGQRLGIRHAPGVLPMDAKPAASLRRGQDSSMWGALRMVADGEAGACVSGGSTAALMTLGVKLIGMLTGIQRPALMAHVPAAKGYTGMLDLGANISVNASQLVQFAVMGSVTAEVADGIERPRVALLNVGHEDSKGHEVVREAHRLLKDLPLNYIGFIEGHDIFSGKADIAVCDGFAGNLILKSSEGLVRLLLSELSNALHSGPITKLGALLVQPALRRTLARLDPAAHNGAPLLGLNGVVLKSHGHAGVKAMTHAILDAGREARRGVPERIGAAIRAFHLEADA